MERSLLSSLQFNSVRSRLEDLPPTMELYWNLGAKAMKNLFHGQELALPGCAGTAGRGGWLGLAWTCFMGDWSSKTYSISKVGRTGHGII